MIEYLKQKTVIISLAGCVLLIFGNFLPLVEIASDTLSYARAFAFIEYEGKLLVFLSILAALFILLKESKYAAGPLGLSLALLLYLVINKSTLYDDCAFYEAMFSWGIGLYVLFIGDLLAFTHPIYDLLKDKVTINLKKKK